jgi:hypothetical protein
LALTTIIVAEPIAQQAQDHLIVPGERIGPISIGMSTKQLFAVMGDPNATNGGHSYTWGSKESGELSASTDLNGVVTWITTTHPAFATSDAVQVGSSSLMVMATLGRPGTSFKPYCAYDGSHCEFHCYKSGLMVDYNTVAGRVLALNVVSPKKVLKLCDRKK